MTTGTIITCIVVGIVFLALWALVITTFIRMIGKVDDNIVRIIYHSEFAPIPTIPTPIDEEEDEPEEVEDNEEEVEDTDENNINSVHGE